MSKGKINVSVENIFPLIKKFLYSDHEIFLRELISNATDATLKLKHLSSIGEVKGTWYFNKRQGELKYRILGLSPVAPDVYTLDKPEAEQDLVELFWIWFPDARESLNTSTVFNTRNSSQPITYDHMLNSRRFNSIIYKEENVYEDRLINEYIFEDALQQLLESERIKNVIRDFEQDLWNN